MLIENFSQLNFERLCVHARYLVKQQTATIRILILSLSHSLALPAPSFIILTPHI